MLENWWKKKLKKLSQKMSRVNFIFILSFIFFNFSFNNVFASSEFSNDFIEQAKKLGITIDKKIHS